MRIISPKLRDYYDGCQDPSDKELTYLRSPAKVDGKIVAFPEFTKYATEAYRRHYFNTMQHVFEKPRYLDTVNPVVVMFCGKVYHGVRTAQDMERGVLGRTYQIQYHWSVESLYANAKHLGSSPMKYTNKDLNDYNYNAGWFKGDTVPNAVQAESYATRTPIIIGDWVYTGLEFECNGRLADVGFQKVHDAWSCFQELSMFFGACGINKDPEPIEDKYRVTAHGFDEMSFRKSPTKKH